LLKLLGRAIEDYGPVINSLVVLCLRDRNKDSKREIVKLELDLQFYTRRAGERKTRRKGGEYPQT
jgi:hypothetical protein